MFVKFATNTASVNLNGICIETFIVLLWQKTINSILWSQYTVFILQKDSILKSASFYCKYTKYILCCFPILQPFSTQ